MTGIGENTYWFGEGERTPVRGGCRQCGGRLLDSTFRETPGRHLRTGVHANTDVGVDQANLYHDLASGVRDDRPGLDNCLCALCARTTCSSSGSSIASAATSPIWSTRSSRCRKTKWLAQAAMEHRDTSVSELCCELGIKPVTLYRYVASRARGSSPPEPECSVLDAGGARAQRSTSRIPDR